MIRKENFGWRPVQLPKSLVDEVENLLKTSKVKKQGITSISQFISRAVNDELLRLESARMSQVSIHQDHVRIMDDNIGKMGRIVLVYFKKGDSSWCGYCRQKDCIHVQYAWEIPDARVVLKRHGLEYPSTA